MYLQKLPIGAAAVLLTGVVCAQTASITGTVTDSSGATIPAARLVATNIATNIEREIESSDSGDYTITNLAPGEYNLTAQKPGFRRLQQTGIILQVEQTARIDLALEIGSVAEAIEVHASAPLLNTENAVKGDVIIAKEIVEMPLDGRDFADLAYLVPGVYRRAQGGQGSGMAINGARGDNTNFTIDGFNDQNPRGGAAQARPPIDAMQEFKMQTSGYSAEYGRLAGGVMTMVLKTGGNRYHGTLFEFLRNDLFDARNFFDGERRSKLRRNQFGGEIDGPVRIPKLFNGRDRVFFLASWESYRQSLGANRLGRVPTALEKTGDFSSTVDVNSQPVNIKDPYQSAACTTTSRAGCFPNNIIPRSLLHPTSLKLQEFYPLLNRSGQVNNYQVNANDADTWNSFLGKLDIKLSEKDTISGRAMQRRNSTQNPFNGSDLGSFGNYVREAQSMVGLTWTRLFTSTLINEARIGLTRTRNQNNSNVIGPDYPSQFGITGVTNDPDLRGFPRVTIQDLMTLGPAAEVPVRFAVNNWQFGDTITWARSKHVFKTGAEILRTQFFQPHVSNQRGLFNFLGRWTNDSYGDFLLGLLNNTTRQVESTRNYLFNTSYGFFAQDDWKVRNNLTINLGIRYEILRPPEDKYGRMANYVPHLGQVIVSDDNALPNLNQILIDTGLTGKAALASDVGLPRSLVYTNWRNFAPRIGFAWRPFGGTKTVIRAGYGYFYGGSLMNPIRGSLGATFPFVLNETYARVTTNVNLLTFSDPFPGTRRVFSGVVNVNGFELKPKPQSLQSWNLTLERELKGGTALEVAYVGSKGSHLGRQFDINQPYFDLARRLPDNSFPRPLPGFNTINYYQFGSSSIYNAGMITLRQRLTRSSFFRVNYVFSKSIDDASQISGNSDGGFPGVQDARNPKLERARSDWDARHAFLFNYTWQIPFAQRNRWLGGWQLAGTGRAYSGQPFTPRTANAVLGNGEATRPDRIASGIVDNPTPERWFDVSAFPVVPLNSYRFGTSGRNILDGPGFSALNFSLLKRFPIGEGRAVQFRWEVFNATNHTNFELPEVFVNNRNGATITAASQARSMQFGLKYIF